MAWNQPASNNNSAARKASKYSPSIAKGTVTGLVVIAILGFAVYFIFGRKDVKHVAEPNEKKPTQIVEAKPSAAPVAVEPETPKEDPAKVERREKLAKMTQLERMDFFFEEAKKRRIDLTPSTNRAFKTQIEQQMSWIFMTKLGDMPPPMLKMPMLDEAHLAEILISDNPVLTGDSEKVQRAKENVELAKKELRTFLKSGGDVKEFLDYYRGQLVQANNEWRESQRSVMKVVREDPDIAGEYLKEVNKRLTEKGIKPVVLPPKTREKLGLVED